MKASNSNQLLNTSQTSDLYDCLVRQLNPTVSFSVIILIKSPYWWWSISQWVCVCTPVGVGSAVAAGGLHGADVSLLSRGCRHVSCIFASIAWCHFLCGSALCMCVYVCVVVLCGRVGVDRGGTQLRLGSQLSVPHKPTEQTQDRRRESGCFLESGLIESQFIRSWWGRGCN